MARPGKSSSNSSAFGVGERANFGATTSKVFENHFARRRMIDATTDERLATRRSRLVCRHSGASSEHVKFFLRAYPSGAQAIATPRFRRKLLAPAKISAHRMALEAYCISPHAPPIDTYRCAGPWEHTLPAKQLSARRLSAMTPKAAKRTNKRRPARRKENQKPKSAATRPIKAQKTKRRLQSLRRRAERQDRTPKLTRRDEHSSLAKSLGVRSLDLFRSFCPHESF